jgi:NAD(P)-dependent dehydrogenase (short-subunit alcohol dehydrogenase family)
MTAAEWDEVLATNLSSVFYCTKTVLEPMIQRGFGRVINIASLVAQTGAFGQANYAAAQAGVIAFSKSLAQEVARNGITVNAICPGLGSLDRPGEAEEVARLVRFLCTDGEWITGAQLNVHNDGGFL